VLDNFLEISPFDGDFELFFSNHIEGLLHIDFGDLSNTAAEAEIRASL